MHCSVAMLLQARCSPNPRGEPKNRATPPFFSRWFSGLCGHLMRGGPVKPLEPTPFHRRRHRRTLPSHRHRRLFIFKRSARSGINGLRKVALAESADHLCKSMTSFLPRSSGRTQKREICCIVKSKKQMNFPNPHPCGTTRVPSKLGRPEFSITLLQNKEKSNSRKCD